MENNLIEVKNLNFKYGKESILEDISFNIKNGQNVGILGRNGGGKSTLVKIILGFLKPGSGAVIYNIEKNNMGYLPQLREFDSSFPITIFDLVISGLLNKENLFRKFNEKEKKEALEIIKEFEITDIQNKLISSVSGGQLQRALIARAMIRKPKLLILDEPESFLDKNFEQKLYFKLSSMKDTTLLIISHELDTVSKYVDSILLVEKKAQFYENIDSFMFTKGDEQ